MASRVTDIIQSTRHAQITEDLTAIHVTYTRTHYTRFYTDVDEDEWKETFEEYKEYVMVLVDVFDLVTGRYVNTMISVE